MSKMYSPEEIAADHDFRGMIAEGRKKYEAELERLGLKECVVIKKENGCTQYDNVLAGNDSELYIIVGFNVAPFNVLCRRLELGGKPSLKFYYLKDIL